MDLLKDDDQETVFRKFGDRVDILVNNAARRSIPDRSAPASMTGWYDTVDQWYDPEKNPSHRALAEELFNLFLNGITSTSRSAPAP